MTREELAALRMEQDSAEAVAEAVRDRIGDTEWNALIGFNTYCANRLGLVVEFYRRENDTPSYRLRPRTEEEKQAWAEDVVEDNL